MIITPEGNILSGSKILDRLMYMICFWILGEKKFKKVIGENELNQLYEDYNTVHGDDAIFPKNYDKK